MIRLRWMSPMAVAILVAIGCGGKPQDAAATTKTEEPAAAEAPVQLAEAPAGAAAPAAGGGSASITGTARFEGTTPQPTKVKMDADPVCAQQHQEPVFTEDVVVNPNGTLKNVIVYVKDGLSGSYPAPTTPVVLDQRGCWYSPHAFAIQADQPLEIINDDPTMHNVNAKPTQNPPFNIAQPTKGMKSTKKFTKPEVGVKFKCNVHPWMSAYAVVTTHPFHAVTDAEGNYSLKGLPAGTYTVEAWHEKLGAQTQSVTVGDGQSQAAEFSFKGQ
jgi:hypothetical protein